jgi:cardiolipin synthase
MKCNKSILILLLAISCASPSVITMVSPPYPVDDERFISTITAVSGRSITTGNTINILNTGKETFDTLLRMLSEAKSSINIEIYIFDDDRIGQRIARTLIERASAGVTVNLLVDAVGGRGLAGTETERKMLEGGVNLRYYNEFRFPFLLRYNQRTHKKIVIVDGRQGVTGGFGFSDAWDDTNDSSEKMRDMQLYIEGPIIEQMLEDFDRNWIETIGPEAKNHRSLYQRVKKRIRGLKARFIGSSPYRGKGTLQQLLLFTIKSSRSYFWMETAYFVPDRLLVNALKEASRRGVDVRIMLATTDRTDVTATVYAGRNYYEELLETGIQIYEYQKKRLHSKFFIMDDGWCSVGSANFDNRSMKISDEGNLNIYEEQFVKKLKEIFLEDLKDSTAVRIEKFQKRGVTDRFKELLYGLFESQL